MTPKDCMQRVERVGVLADDDERAHSEEDSALWDFVAALAANQVRRPVECAKILQQMREIEFARWYA